MWSAWKNSDQCFVLWQWLKFGNDSLEMEKYVLKCGKIHNLDMTIVKCCYRYAKRGNFIMSR